MKTKKDKEAEKKVFAVVLDALAAEAERKICQLNYDI